MQCRLDDWIKQIEAIEALDFEIFAPAHGNIGAKEDAAEVRAYIESLRAQVLEGLEAGKSADLLVDEITTDDYRHWAQNEAWREENLRGMAKFLSESGRVKQ